MASACSSCVGFVLAVDFDDFAEVAVGNGLRGLHGTVQRRDDAAGQQPGQQHRGNGCEHSDDDDAGDGAVVILAGLNRRGFGVGGVDRDQLVELFAHLVGAVLDPRVDQGAHLVEFVLTRQLHHLVLRLQVVVQRGREGLVQRPLFRAGRQCGVAGLSTANLVDQTRRCGSALPANRPASRLTSTRNDRIRRRRTFSVTTPR